MERKNNTGKYLVAGLGVGAFIGTMAYYIHNKKKKEQVDTEKEVIKFIENVYGIDLTNEKEQYIDFSNPEEFANYEERYIELPKSK